MAAKGIRPSVPLALLGLRIGWGNFKARLRGEERDVRRAALAHVQAKVKPGDPAALLDALDDFGRNRRFLMNVGDRKGPLLAAMVGGLAEGARVLELGAFVGYSAVLISRALPAGGKLVSVEYDPVAAEVAAAMVAHAGLADRVEFREGDSAAVIPTLGAPFDLVFIDHWKDLYLCDLQLIEQHGLLRKASVVVADNVGPMFQAHAYLGYVRGCGHYDTRYEKSTLEYSEVEDGIEISVFKG
jgi:catechol O-methyltransferase